MSFWGDAIEYAAYILNCNPTSANPKSASPLEMMTKHAPELRDIIAFDSVSSVYRDPRMNSLEKRSQVGVMIGRSDKTKSYRVFHQNENKITVTQYVKDIETFSEAQNNQLQRAFNYKDQAAAASTATASLTRQIQYRF